MRPSPSANSAALAAPEVALPRPQLPCILERQSVIHRSPRAPPPPQVMAIDPKWLVELAPRFFKPADAHRLSRRKRMERIEPLYDRFNDPNAWRLSKRRG
jgi:hypothetical protein